MPKLSFQLVDWEYECCGEDRWVGEDVTVRLRNVGGQWVEQRHDYGNGLSRRLITGTILAITWRPGILRRLNELTEEVSGYGAAVALESTANFLAGEWPPHPWAFEYVLETLHRVSKAPRFSSDDQGT